MSNGSQALAHENEEQRVVEATASSKDVAQCSSCGGVLVYNPSKKALQCLYCGTESTMAVGTPSRPRTYNDQTEQNFEDWDSRLQSFKCSACGAISELSRYESSLSCPFCDAPNMIKQEEVRGLKPTAILPFLIDRDSAIVSYKKWIKKKLFAPNQFKKKFDEADMKGVYIPCFSFSASTRSSYKGRLGKKYTVTVGTGKNKRTETRIKYFNVSGDHSDFFENLLYEVSSKINQKELRKIGHFDVSNAIEYNVDYIPGFSQERYTESLDATFGRAKNDMDATIRRKILNKYDADVVDSLSVWTEYGDKRYQYLMAPIWECYYKYKQKGYRMVVNGRSAKITGKTPLSFWKILITCLVAVGAIVGLYFLIM